MPVATRSQAAYNGLPNNERAEQSTYSRSMRAHHASQKAKNSSRINSRRQKRKDGSEDIPVFTIDLSQKPEDRYVHVAESFGTKIAHLPVLFDEVVSVLPGPFSNKTLHRIARLLLRRIPDQEQMAELRGISKVTGIEMYLLIAFNVLLDLFMGCTSGGVRVHGENGHKMLHFRTLDWGMDPLRKVVVQLEFVERPNGPVIATNVTYAGFVGVLTGVRKDFSVSLNFRGSHNGSDSKYTTARYRFHQLCVLLGFRPSIASLLRHTILPPAKKQKGWWDWLFREDPSDPSVFRMWMDAIPSIRSTSCYLICSNGEKTYVIEKDRVTGRKRSSEVFISATNHDVGCEDDKESQHEIVEDTPDITGMKEMLEESVERKCELQMRYDLLVAAAKSHHGRGDSDSRSEAGEDELALSQSQVEELITAYPTINECTHYAVLMDPKANRVAWARRWRRPPKPNNLPKRQSLEINPRTHLF